MLGQDGNENGNKSASNLANAKNPEVVAFVFPEVFYKFYSDIKVMKERIKIIRSKCINFGT